MAIPINFKNEWFLPGLFSIFYGVGLGLHLSTKTLPFMLHMTDLVLLAGNMIVFIVVYQSTKKRKLFLLWFFSTLLITWIIEMVGVSTGIIFGTYAYGNTMKLKVFGVPLIIGINWAILILATHSLSLWISVRWIRPIFAALLIILFDYFMEPVAQKLDYWQWFNHDIPLQNYVAWALLTLIFSAVLEWGSLYIRSRLLRFYFFIQLTFFILLFFYL